MGQGSGADGSVRGRNGSGPGRKAVLMPGGPPVSCSSFGKLKVGISHMSYFYIR